MPLKLGQNAYAACWPVITAVTVPPQRRDDSGGVAGGEGKAGGDGGSNSKPWHRKLRVTEHGSSFQCGPATSEGGRKHHQHAPSDEIGTGGQRATADARGQQA